MRAPAFWQRPAGLAAGLLAPVGWLYGAAAASRMARPGASAPCPLICVGNPTAGGAGKTPTALALADLLRAAGERPAFLTRGYGGRAAGPLAVDSATHDSAEVGDEALLLARQATTVVSRDRPAGAALCARAGASVIVMDDGLQNPSLAKDLAFAVVDAETGIGNGLCLPAGPLRAPMEAQWPKIAALILVGKGEPGAAVARQAILRGLPVFSARLVPDAECAAALRGRRVLAFAGIGRPQKFFDTLEACGAIVAEAQAFPDHHAFGRREIAGLLDRAERKSLLAVTTEKDLVRIDGAEASRSTGNRIVALPVRLVFEDAQAVLALTAAAIEAARARRRA